MRNMFIICLALFISGCASTRVDRKPLIPVSDSASTKYRIEEIVNKSKEQRVPDHFIKAIVSHLKLTLKESDMLEGGDSPESLKVSITITSYRMRSEYKRGMWGPMAGKDKVVSTITVTDEVTDEVLGESTASTYNMLAVSNEMDIARKHSEEIAEFLTGKKH